MHSHLYTMFSNPSIKGYVMALRMDVVELLTGEQNPQGFDVWQ